MVGTDEPLWSFRLSVNHFTLSAFSRPRFTHRHPTRIAAGALCHALVCKAFSLWSGVSVLLRLTTPSSLRSFAPVPPFPTASSSPTIANIRCRTCQCSASLHIVTHDERITAQSASVCGGGGGGGASAYSATKWSERAETQTRAVGGLHRRRLRGSPLTNP